MTLLMGGNVLIAVVSFAVGSVGAASQCSRVLSNCRELGSLSLLRFAGNPSSVVAICSSVTRNLVSYERMVSVGCESIREKRAVYWQ